jgi:hypothetical protein
MRPKRNTKGENGIMNAEVVFDITYPKNNEPYYLTWKKGGRVRITVIEESLEDYYAVANIFYDHLANSKFIRETFPNFVKPDPSKFEWVMINYQCALEHEVNTYNLLNYIKGDTDGVYFHVNIKHLYRLLYEGHVKGANTNLCTSITSNCCICVNGYYLTRRLRQQRIADREFIREVLDDLIHDAYYAYRSIEYSVKELKLDFVTYTSIYWDAAELEAELYADYKDGSYNNVISTKLFDNPARVAKRRCRP